MSECIYQGCTKSATHILVDYHHEIIDEGIFYCASHAFVEDREKCPHCYDYQIEFDDENGMVDFLPTYPQNTLDNEGCCSEHP